MWFIINHFISPKKFFTVANYLLPWMITLFIILFSYAMIGGLVLAPADYLQGEAFRIIYVHAPCAFLSLFIYAVMAGASVLGLIFHLKMAFIVIRHSVLMGAGFTFLALVTGSIWGKPMWGTWWIWDARLTSELILLFLYLGILFFQESVAHKKSGERAVAILVLMGFIDIPIIHFSVYWWNTLHQGATIKLFSASTMDNSMLYPLLASIAAFILYYGIILFIKIRHELITTQKNYEWLQDRSCSMR